MGLETGGMLALCAQQAPRSNQAFTCESRYKNLYLPARGFARPHLGKE